MSTATKTRNKIESRWCEHSNKHPLETPGYQGVGPKIKMRKHERALPANKTHGTPACFQTGHVLFDVICITPRSLVSLITLSLALPPSHTNFLPFFAKKGNFVVTAESRWHSLRSPFKVSLQSVAIFTSHVSQFYKLKQFML